MNANIANILHKTNKKGDLLLWWFPMLLLDPCTRTDHVRKSNRVRCFTAHWCDLPATFHSYALLPTVSPPLFVCSSIKCNVNNVPF